MMLIKVKIREGGDKESRFTGRTRIIFVEVKPDSNIALFFYVMYNKSLVASFFTISMIYILTSNC